MTPHHKRVVKERKDVKSGRLDSRKSEEKTAQCAGPRGAQGGEQSKKPEGFLGHLRKGDLRVESVKPQRSLGNRGKKDSVEVR